MRTLWVGLLIVGAFGMGRLSAGDNEARAGDRCDAELETCRQAIEVISRATRRVEKQLAASAAPATNAAHKPAAAPEAPVVPVGPPRAEADPISVERFRQRYEAVIGAIDALERTRPHRARALSRRAKAIPFQKALQDPNVRSRYFIELGEIYMKITTGR